MGIINALNRRKSIAALTERLDDPDAMIMKTLMKTFTDSRLNDLVEFHNLDKRGPLNRRFQKPVERHDELVQQVAHLVIRESTRQSGTASLNQLIADMKFLSKVMLWVMKEYDPDGTKYPEARDNAPDFIMFYMEALIGSHRNALRDKEDTAAFRKQLFTFLAVTFLTRTEGNHRCFYPRFGAPDGRYASILTSVIMQSPDGDPKEYANAYIERRNLREGLEKKFRESLWDSDIICDYPDHLIKRIIDIKNVMPASNAWSQINTLLAQMNSVGATSELEDFLDTVGPLYEQCPINDLYDLLRAVDRFKQIRDAKESFPVAEHNRQRAGLLHVMLALYTNRTAGTAYKTSSIYDSYKLISDQRVIDLIISNPDHGVLIANVINDRHHYDHEAVLDILRSGALGSGAL